MTKIFITKKNTKSKMTVSVQDGDRIGEDDTSFAFLDNPADIITHIYLRDQTKNISAPSINEYTLYSTKTNGVTQPSTFPVALNNGDYYYNGTNSMVSIIKTSVKDFLMTNQGEFTISMWVKISSDNPLNSYLMGGVEANTAIGIILNRSSIDSIDHKIYGNTLFYLKSNSANVTFGYIKKNICNNKYINLTWVSKIEAGKHTFQIFINGQKVTFYLSKQLITDTDTFSSLSKGLGLGLWARDYTTPNATNTQISDSSNINRYAKFTNSTFTIYDRPLTQLEIMRNYNSEKQNYEIETEVPIVKIFKKTNRYNNIFSSGEGWPGVIQNPDKEATDSIEEKFLENFESWI